MMTPDALAILARRQGPTYELARSRHLLWRWWVFLFVFGEPIDEQLCFTKRGAERIGREFVKRLRTRAEGQS